MSPLVMALLTALVPIPVLGAAALYLVNAGIRAGDRPGDVTVTAVMGSAARPDGRGPVVAATVRNPGATPVLVGLSVRPGRLPGWLTAGPAVTVPRRTVPRRTVPRRTSWGRAPWGGTTWNPAPWRRAARRRLAAGHHDVVGVVGPGETARWTVPVTGPARRCRLVAAAGQADGRLRVIELPVPAVPAQPPAAQPPAAQPPAAQPPAARGSGPDPELRPARPPRRSWRDRVRSPG